MIVWLIPLQRDMSRCGRTRVRRDRAMNEAEKEIKQRDKTIAGNESERQTVSAIRLSTWAVAIALLIGLAVFGWVMLH